MNPLDPQQAPLGQGLAQQAGNTVDLRKMYTEYALASQMNGQQPVPFPQWAQQQGQPVLKMPGM